jgi:hypothetical protein
VGNEGELRGTGVEAGNTEWGIKSSFGSQSWQLTSQQENSFPSFIFPLFEKLFSCNVYIFTSLLGTIEIICCNAFGKKTFLTNKSIRVLRLYLTFFFTHK